MRSKFEVSWKKIAGFKYLFNEIMCLLICTWMVLPYFRMHSNVLTLLIIFIAWVATTDITWLTQKLPWNVICIGLFFLTFVPYVLFGNLEYGDRGSNVVIVNFSLFFFGLLINYYYMYFKKDFVALGRIALTSLIFGGLGALQTYLGLLKYPMASRQLAGSIANNIPLQNIYKGLGIGGFGHIYAITFIFIASLYLILNRNLKIDIRIRILIFWSLTCMFFMILKASYATSVLLLIFGLLLIFFVKNIKTLAITLVLLCLIIILLPKYWVGIIILKIAKLFNFNSIINEKLLDLANSFLNTTGVSQTMYRVRLYYDSFITFINQPIFGIYGPFSNLGKLGINSVGGHSGWLDLLAFYGLFTGVPLFASLILTVKKHLSYFKNHSYYKFIIILYFLFTVFGLINPVLSIYEIGFTLFCIVPTIPFLPFAFSKKLSVQH